ncbi:MAG: hypothetical protein RL514_2167 [Verrucomicrobiota bacterium]|jgi:hypothetical protein
MSLRRYILGTVTANLALVGALLWQAARSPSPATAAGLNVTTNVVTEFVNEPAPPAPVVKVPGSPPFHWSQVEATNYLTYATNLLAIGCPPETARDVLVARVADAFLVRARELTRPLQGRFWEVMAERGELKELFENAALEELLKGLKAERERVQVDLQAVLGKAVPAEKPVRNEQFGHLPESKQTEVAALDSRHGEEISTLNREVAQATPAERSAKKKALRDRQQTERRVLFSDGEWDEAELRRSAQAAQVRELRGFSATADELRSLARTLRDFDTTHPRPTPRDPKQPAADPDYQPKVEARETARKELLTARLGQGGFAAFERGGDPRFHTLLKLARRLELPPASAAQWLDLQTAAQTQVRQLRENVDLPAEARALALLALRVETERTLQAAVGARGWSAYQRHAGDWLGQLAK